jgi:ABC-type cobalamin/Fe3+-siderophores transport system ATPase subunit
VRAVPALLLLSALLALLDAGRLVALGQPDKVLTPERLRAVYGVQRDGLWASLRTWP